MPTIRKVPLITGQIYHIFNRGIDKRTTFANTYEYARAYQIMKFYRFSIPPFSLSRFLRLGNSKREKLQESSWGEKLVNIFAYCFMPNHFHFILEQQVDGGISKYVGQFLNSYTRYFNIKNERVGQLFLDQFKNVLVENEEQLLHLSRYVHLNPYSSLVISSLGELMKYEWSSLGEYIGGSEDGVCDKAMIMSYFKTKDSYKNFVLDQADYQRYLKRLEHLIVEE